MAPFNIEYENFMSHNFIIIDKFIIDESQICIRYE